MSKKPRLKSILFLVALISCCQTGIAADGLGAIDPQDSVVSIYCNENNDLYQLLLSSGHKVTRYDDIDMALKSTPDGGTLMVLAKGYPKEKTVLPEDFYRRAREKKLKVYVEFPDRLVSGKTGAITTTEKERLVVTSDSFGKDLQPMDILDAGLYRYVKVPDRESFLKGAKVAGFKTAVYGLEDTPNSPILFEDRGVMVATTKLSDFNKSRYSPHDTWRNTLAAMLTKLGIGVEFKEVEWSPVVRPTFKAKAALTREDYGAAVDRGAGWYVKSRFLIHPQWRDHWRSIDTLALPVGPPMDLSLPSGDGSLGIMEGHYSYINPDGSQPYRYWLRADCVAETAMTFAMANGNKENKKFRETSINLMDFLYNSDTFITADSKDPSKSSYGLVGWADTHKSRYYGDDNARVILGSILAGQTLGRHDWDRQIAELILANFRTSGKEGFRSSSLNGADIDKITWQVLMARELEHIAPHFESWLWATYLWLYDKTGYRPLLEKAKKAIGITMANYPTNWKWTNGLQQERARMILPLAWLLRVDDTKQHRTWLNLLCDDLLEYQVASGAFREALGVGSNGKYGAPAGNAQYGTTEAPVIHENGDPVADMLYTTNFAFFALNEAAQATQDPKYLKAVDRLADFLVRIQSTSSGRADLDGCWFRAFDYESWEYYGSNADLGWGAWGTLTGWTQSFITTTLAIKLENTSYWDKTKESGVGEDMDEVWSQMLPGVKP
ncbi:hypothetical protein K8352_15665 [Flavobacteriaceae bacterium F89]|uniref:Alpha-L-rhamnosidase six-hairpin glycosidase domain-containing protein n=1 Tax=Cerina litoralis TaxID=2874477 RepID=A0AAE3JUA3_9FLAO|nr:hypothetical protein [Cerina litoralis]MCG2462197.1 hypothetical protein [Cerina litoralis]